VGYKPETEVIPIRIESSRSYVSKELVKQAFFRVTLSVNYSEATGIAKKAIIISIRWSLRIEDPGLMTLFL
jgi:hypothetical protein